MALRGTGLVPFTGTGFAPLFGFRRELDRLFNDTFGQQGGLAAWNPAVDVREDNNNIFLDVELPGIKPEDVDISVDNGILTISGEKSTENQENKEDQRFHAIERSYGAFFRSFQLPQGVDENQISANFNNGVLTIDIPKSAIPQPRKIQVGAGRQQVSAGQTRTGGRSSGKGGERMVAGSREGEGQQASGSQQGQSSQSSRSSQQGRSSQQE